MVSVWLSILRIPWEPPHQQRPCQLPHQGVQRTTSWPRRGTLVGLYPLLTPAFQPPSARRGAASTTHHEITWEKALTSQCSVDLERYGFDVQPPLQPNQKGDYDIPVPGITKFI